MTERCIVLSRFMIAGHETTSSATTWCLYALTQVPHVQAKLREELLSVSSDNLDMEALNALPYLDAVVRESLRLHLPVTLIQRMAMKDDVIPLDSPVIDSKGNELHSIGYVLSSLQVCCAVCPVY